MLRTWFCTLRIKCHAADPKSDPSQIDIRKLYGVWHEGLLLPVYVYSRIRAAMMVSNHRDGELIAQVLERMGAVAIRGSSTRGGTRAALNMLREKNATHLALTPDGPKGPRRVAKKGIIFIASRGQMPLIGVGISVEKCWRVCSWDKMIIPKPFSKVYMVFSDAIEVPDGLSNNELDEYLEKFQASLDKAQDVADRLAAGETDEVKLVDWRETLANVE